jgi:hypothetical protein
MITRTSFVTVPGTVTVTKTSSFVKEATDVTDQSDGKLNFFIDLNNLILN